MLNVVIRGGVLGEYQYVAIPTRSISSVYT